MVKWFWAILALALVVSKFRVTDIWYGISLCVFLGVTPKWIRITCLAILQAIESKNIHSRLVGKRPSGNVEKAPLPRKLPPGVGDFRFAVKKCKSNFTTTQVRKTSRTRHMKSCPSDQLKNRKVFFHHYTYNRNGPCSVIPTGAFLTLWKGLNRASGKTMPSP